MNFKKGDLVRISKLRGVFDKKYEQSFTNEVFTVSERIPRDPPVYKLKDYDGEPIQGSFYEPELQKEDAYFYWREKPQEPATESEVHRQEMRESYFNAISAFRFEMDGQFRRINPLAKKGFEIAKPHLKAAASNIASNAVKHVMERFAGDQEDDQEMKQEGSGGIMVLSRRKRRRPPGERIPSSFNKQPFAPMTQLSIDEKTYTEISPLSAITDGGPIEFFIPGDGDRYLDLNDTLLHLRVKITNPNGSNLANDAAVGLINYPLNTIFSQCDVTLGDRLISQSSATHPYRCMIETLLNFSPDTLSSQFTGGLFYKDTAGSVDSIVLVNGPNKGLTRRAASTARSREVHLLGPLHGDIFFCERLLLNSVDLRIKLTRANDAFCLMGARDSAFSLKVLGASLFVKKVAVSPAVRLGHAAALMKGNALYPLSRVNVKTYSIPANSRVCNQENLFLGSIPKYVVLGMVHHEAFTGRRDLSPFNFRHYDIEYLALCQDGRQVPAKAFQPDFNNGVSVREFYNIDDNDALSTVSNGNLRLELRFRTPLQHTATLIVYACYDSILEINAKRQVLVDYY
ncbi:hypothetical protein D4764_17G0006750 [Takifugu flavidus]|uniref:Uncharacterized protein n=1 Tax=Takifugu flavidus TaxID=433684 RepID=A0A5C6NUP3_9TELE|nr:hypothetical protein D4764_17G0006750 [Takifugu flavidus]